jgi:hypothetical protein
MEKSSKMALVALLISIASACFSGWGVFESHRNPRLANRPFIAVTAIPDGEHDIQFELHAAGTTAAMNVSVKSVCTYDTHLHWNPDYAKSHAESAASEADYHLFMEKELLVPGMVKALHCAPFIEERPANALPPGRGVYTRFIHGVVRYDDVFGNTHKTEFCFFHPPLSFSDSLVGCPAYTSAD